MDINGIKIEEMQSDVFRKNFGKLDKNSIYRITKFNKTFAYFLPVEGKEDTEDMFESFFMSLYAVADYFNIEKDKIQLLKNYYPYKDDKVVNIEFVKMSMFDLLQFGMQLKSLTGVALEMDKVFKLAPIITNIDKHQEFIKKYKNDVDVSALEKDVETAKHIIKDYKLSLSLLVDVFKNNIGDFALNSLNNPKENNNNV